MRSWLECHQCLRHLAPFLMRHRNDGRLVNVRMSRKHLFHFKRGDVLATTDDDVLSSVDDHEIAVTVDRSHVPRIKPSSCERLFARFRTKPVTFHDTVPTRTNLPYCLPIVRHIVAPFIHDAHFHAWDGESRHCLSCMSPFAQRHPGLPR